MSRSILVASLSGASTEGERRVVAFNIDYVAVSRQNSPATSENGQGPSSLQSVPVGLPRPVRPQQLDQARWSILDTEWRRAKAVWGPKVH
jgi:hypothetical protein